MSLVLPGTQCQEWDEDADEERYNGTHQKMRPLYKEVHVRLPGDLGVKNCTTFLCMYFGEAFLLGPMSGW